MRFLGIDFGTRKVGLALSDEGGQMAFPIRVIAVSNDIANNIADIVKKEFVGAVVIGDSRNFKGEENPLMKKVHIFKKELSERVDVPIYLESEVLTSQEAQRIQGNVTGLDASAAAIILQSFLDKQKI